MERNVEVRQTKNKDRGVFALRNFRKGEVVFTNVRGEFLKEKDLKRIIKREGDHLNEIDKETWEIMNPPGRYINHSCDPNVVSKESARKNVPYIALKAIKKGEELTGDYRINAFIGNTWKCNCGSKNCKGKVTSDFFTLSPMLQKKYFPYSSKYIKSEYKKRRTNL